MSMKTVRSLIVPEIKDQELENHRELMDLKQPVNAEKEMTLYTLATLRPGKHPIIHFSCSCCPWHSISFHIMLL